MTGWNGSGRQYSLNRLFAFFRLCKIRETIRNKTDIPISRFPICIFQFNYGLDQSGYVLFLKNQREINIIFTLF